MINSSDKKMMYNSIANTVNSSDKTQYGSVANGIQVGSGFDVTIKRETANFALVNVETPNGEGDWLTAIDVEPDTDLQSEAKDIGNCPEFGGGGYVTRDDDAWDNLAARWNAIGVR